MEANSVMGLFFKLIAARVDYSLSAMEKDTDVSVQSASQGDSQEPKKT